MSALRLPRGFSRIPLRTPTLPPAQHTNCYIVGHEEALVVDPGSPFPGAIARLLRILWRLRGRGGRVAAVLVTHHHADHHGGATAIARALDAPVAAHRETLLRLRLCGVQRIEVEEGHRFEADPGLELTCLHCPGHAPGHLCLSEPGRRVLIVGDMVPGVGTTLVAPPDGDMSAYLASLERLAALQPRLLLPAHGPPLDQGADAILRLVTHRLWREQRIIDALTRGPLDLWAVTREAYADLPPWLLGLATRSTRAHLDKLHREGRVAARGETWRVTA
ncbi:MAG: MBL fold metallo-hydrolase [Deltaproteobacteria bacterium]|jgi:glyoxylase-like metal-dependent hydrolase (beta-lactamase superfamily II)|nr:MBL fold metallo-hydrolase [Deltaproteobacteria bacterium]